MESMNSSPPRSTTIDVGVAGLGLAQRLLEARRAVEIELAG